MSVYIQSVFNLCVSCVPCAYMPGALLESVLNSQLLGQLCNAMCHTHIGLLLQSVRFESTNVRENM